MKNMKFCKMSFFLSKRIIKVNNEDEEKKSYIINYSCLNLSTKRIWAHKWLKERFNPGIYQNL